MEVGKTICALAAALSFAVGGCNGPKTEAVHFPEKGCSFNNYYFTFQDDELVSVDAPCVENLTTRTCLYTPGNKKQCKDGGFPKKVSPEVINKYLRIYEEGQKK
jgi:hypothetical protein